MKKKMAFGVLHYGSGLLIALLIFWGFYCFIKNDNWLAVTSLATLVLALGAFLSIWQNHLLQKRERRERLLNEIIEWAEDVAGCGSDINILFFPDASDLRREPFERQEIAEAMTRTHLGTLLLRYKAIVARREYVRTAVSAFGRNLPAKEKDVSDELNKFLPVLDRRIKGNATNEDMKKAEEKLNECARILIEEATKIKTKDIGQKEENMPKEGEDTGGNEPTLKNIEDHLKQQDIQMKKGNYLTGAAFGAAIALVGISFMVQMSFQLSRYVYIGFFIVVGLGFMFWCQWKQSKVK